MTPEEKRDLMTLDGKVDAIPAELSREELHIYRQLLIKYISEPMPERVSQRRRRQRGHVCPLPGLV